MRHMWMLLLLLCNTHYYYAMDLGDDDWGQDANYERASPESITFKTHRYDFAKGKICVTVKKKELDGFIFPEDAKPLFDNLQRFFYDCKDFGEGGEHFFHVEISLEDLLLPKYRTRGLREVLDQAQVIGLKEETIQDLKKALKNNKQEVIRFYEQFKLLDIPEKNITRFQYIVGFSDQIALLATVKDRKKS